jgi:hypothetical protein
MDRVAFLTSSDPFETASNGHCEKTLMFVTNNMNFNKLLSRVIRLNLYTVVDIALYNLTIFFTYGTRTKVSVSISRSVVDKVLINLRG